MAEGMGIDMGQAFPLAELGQPLGNGVRSDGAAVGLGEHVIRLHPPVTVGQLQFHLGNPVTLQQRKGFLWERDVPLIKLRK